MGASAPEISLTIPWENTKNFGILNDTSKVVYTLLILYFGIEIWNLKFEIGKNTKNVDVLLNFKFRISSFDISIQFDNTRFF